MPVKDLAELDRVALGLERDRPAREHLAVPLDRGIVAGDVAAADLRLLVAEHRLAVDLVDDLAAAVDLDLDNAPTGRRRRSLTTS